MQTVRIFSSDIGMQFGISKCAMLEMQKSNMQIEAIALLNGDTIKSLEDEKGYKYLGVLQFDSVKRKEIKDMKVKEYHQRIPKILKGSLNGEHHTSC